VPLGQQADQHPLDQPVLSDDHPLDLEHRALEQLALAGRAGRTVVGRRTGRPSRRLTGRASAGFAAGAAAFAAGAAAFATGAAGFAAGAAGFAAGAAGWAPAGFSAPACSGLVTVESPSTAGRLPPGKSSRSKPVTPYDHREARRDGRSARCRDGGEEAATRPASGRPGRPRRGGGHQLGLNRPAGSRRASARRRNGPD